MFPVNTCNASVPWSVTTFVMHVKYNLLWELVELDGLRFARQGRFSKDCHWEHVVASLVVTSNNRGVVGIFLLSDFEGNFDTSAIQLIV